jgi:HAE1 family hydrophobic/amphiphilic exporter-1
LINLKDWDDRAFCSEIMTELEEKSKDIPGANIEFSSHQPYQDMELQEVLSCAIRQNRFWRLQKMGKSITTLLRICKELSNVFSFYSASFRNS